MASAAYPAVPAVRIWPTSGRGVQVVGLHQPRQDAQDLLPLMRGTPFGSSVKCFRVGGSGAAVSFDRGWRECGSFGTSWGITCRARGGCSAMSAPHSQLALDFVAQHR